TGSGTGRGCPVARWTIMFPTRFRVNRLACLSLAALLAACSGGGDSGGPFGPGGGTCGVDSQKTFVRDVTADWYLFPELLPASVNPANYTTAQDLLDAMTATARAQGRDRYFSYVTTRQADSSFLQEGEFIGFGFRIRVDGNRAFFLDVFESSPASEAALARGAELLAIDSGSGFVPLATVLNTDPNLSAAFGPSETGVTRGLRFRRNGTDIQATLTKRIVTITPIPVTGGVEVLTLPSNPSVEVGYVHLRSFISTAETPLRNAFAGFRQQGIQYFIVDLRYNGGGLLSVADVLGDLFGGGRFPGEVFYRLRFNPARSAANDQTRRFSSQTGSVLPVKIAFITTGATASASELIINGLKPWVDPANVAIIGEDTYGKPVGQSAFDQGGCDTRLRLVTFRTANRDDESDYYNGLASTLLRACAAGDDVDFAMEDPNEASTWTALGWLGSATGACPVGTLSAADRLQKAGIEGGSRYPIADRPSPAQVHLPGLF
ncbi:MAG TPA: S41 family peptidase, partial [Gemmatimonadota bacterium]|nr:S41 family peptidase [Gemmatimonadota bacterium]